MSTRRTNSAGFTIIELIFATLIFSLVMTVILVSAFQIGRIYYKGVSISNTNENTRTAIEDITNDIRFSQNASCADPSQPQNCTFNGNIHYFCVGLHRYTYDLLDQVTNDKINNTNSSETNTTLLSGIRQDQISNGCPDPGTAGSSPIQLLGPDMQLNKLSFSCANGACSVGLHVIFYGADNSVFESSAHPNNPALALNDPDAFCSGNLLSSQFCAVSDLQTKVLQRP